MIATAIHHRTPNASGFRKETKRALESSRAQAGWAGIWLLLFWGGIWGLLL